MSDLPIFHTRDRDFAAEAQINLRTVKHYVATGFIRSVKLGPKLRRLETVAEWQRRVGEYRGVEKTDS